MIKKAANNVESEIIIDGVYSSFFPAINNSVPLNDVLTACSLEALVYATDTAIVEKYSQRDKPENWYKKAYPGPGVCHDYYEERMESRHLLTDGLLKIVYEKSGNDWVICELAYSEDFLYASSFYPWYWEQHNYTPNRIFYKQFKILEQDYPPAS